MTTGSKHWINIEFGVSVAILGLMALAVCILPSAVHASRAEEERAEIRKECRETLDRLYSLNPSAKKAVEGADGYAVLNNFGMKIFLAGGGSGKGIAVKKSDGKVTYMRMVEIQAGLGLGVKRFSVVFTFDTEKALDSFVESGWEFGGQATAAAKYDEKGQAAQGAVAVSPGVWMYQLTEKGLALEATVKGMKFYKDKDLN